MPASVFASPHTDPGECAGQDWCTIAINGFEHSPSLFVVYCSLSLANTRIRWSRSMSFPHPCIPRACSTLKCACFSYNITRTVTDFPTTIYVLKARVVQFRRNCTATTFKVHLYPATRIHCVSRSPLAGALKKKKLSTCPLLYKSALHSKDKHRDHAKNTVDVEL